MAPRLDEHVVPTILIGLLSVFGIMLLYFLLAFNNRVTRKKDFVVDFVLIMLASLVCSLLVNAVIFERQILEASINNARETSTEISSRLHSRLSMKNSGLSFDGQKFGFSESLTRFDNFESITLVNSSGKPVYRHEDERDQNPGFEAVIQALVLGRMAESQFQVVEKLAIAGQTNGITGQQ